MEEVDTSKVGSIYIPQAILPPWERLYRVIRAGKECQEVVEGDHIYIAVGVNPSKRNIDGKTYYTIFEQQVDGIFTSIPTNDMSDFTEEEDEDKGEDYKGQIVERQLNALTGTTLADRIRLTQDKLTE